MWSWSYQERIPKILPPKMFQICVNLPFKKNKSDINNPDNNQGIVMLSRIYKLFTAVINSRLTKYRDAIGCTG